MSMIPFVQSPFPNPQLSESAITSRLQRHAQFLAAKRRDLEFPVDEYGEPDDFAWHAMLMRIELPRSVRRRIERRAATISRLHEARHALGHLKEAERELLETVRDGVHIATVPTEHRADEIAAALHDAFPWMAPATEAVWHGMRRSVRSGEPGLRLPPILLDGPPGIGKSRWARHLGALLAVPNLLFEATTDSASFSLVGLQRGWKNAAPGRLVKTILQHHVGSPLVIVDEVEKAGHVTSSNGHAYSLAESLLPLLERVNASKWTCPFYEVAFDMSWVIWVLTSNDYRRLPEPLLSRCPPIRLQPLSRAELTDFARREAKRQGLSEVSTEAITETLARAAHLERISLRTVLRMIERAVMMEDERWNLH